MADFTIRNKSSTAPIMTLGKGLLAQALKARPESVAMMLDMQIRAYRDLTGKTLRVDHEQQLLLAAHAGAEPGPVGSWVWKSKYGSLSANKFYIVHAFEKGLSFIGQKTMPEMLVLVEEFYDMLDKSLS